MEGSRLSSAARALWLRRAMARAAVIVVVGVGALAAGCSNPDGKTGKADLEVGSLERADLAAVRREVARRRGAPLLLNFWAAWCSPCVGELPDLARVERQFAASGVRVLGVSSDLALEDDTPSFRKRVLGILAKAGAAYPNLLYTGSPDSLLEAFDLPGSIPYSILFGPDGGEVKRWEGQISLAELQKALSRLPHPSKPA